MLLYGSISIHLFKRLRARMGVSRQVWEGDVMQQYRLFISSLH